MASTAERLAAEVDGFAARPLLRVAERRAEVRHARQVANLAIAMRDGWDAMLCAVHGHDWRDCSTAGPDSGNADRECVRCGLFVHVPLY